MGENRILMKRMLAEGLTQEELARRMNNALLEVTGRPGNTSARNIHNLLKGRTSWPWRRTRVALERVFGCTAEELGFTPPPSAQQEDPLRRRTFFATAGGVAAVATGLTHRSLGMADVRRLGAELDKLVDLDNHTGGAQQLESRAQAAAQRILDLQQQRSASQRVRSALYLLAASYTSTAMWAAVDAHRTDNAQGHLERANYLATMSGDSSIQYRIWSHAAILALQLHRWPDAIAAAAVARQTSITRRDPFFASLAHARSAGTYASAGERTSALRALDHAAKAWDRVDHELPRPPWMGFFDQAELDGLSAITYLRLGRGAEAEAHARRTLSGLRPDMQRNRLYYTAYLALAQLHQGDIDRACDTADTILDQTVGRSRVVLTEFRRTLHRTAPDATRTRVWTEHHHDTWKDSR
ncbi:hypothetical protein [Streptomyces sp. UNOC14_S4]|uniref:hypothetical protein n=1 Tax=Streptomyces sp. UNOC14_S4 TaxID=2872340 RepID=UPI001E41135B|nr:hypothetical protein [Streptomyces sp. UNOC14_S4]MCC3768177.1 hypothetical protein [Streptomyces sp. UNOC14_S4]